MKSFSCFDLLYLFPDGMRTKSPVMSEVSTTTTTHHHLHLQHPLLSPPLDYVVENGSFHFQNHPHAATLQRPLRHSGHNYTSMTFHTNGRNGTCGQRRRSATDHQHKICMEDPGRINQPVPQHFSTLPRGVRVLASPNGGQQHQVAANKKQPPAPPMRGDTQNKEVTYAELELNLVKSGQPHVKAVGSPTPTSPVPEPPTPTSPTLSSGSSTVYATIDHRLHHTRHLHHPLLPMGSIEEDPVAATIVQVPPEFADDPPSRAGEKKSVTFDVTPDNSASPDGEEKVSFLPLSTAAETDESVVNLTRF